MVHLLTWPRIRLVVRAATIYTLYRGRKHHFRWLLRWRNLPVRANPLPLPPRSASAYGLLTVCFMPLYTWLDVYRHRIPTDRFLLPFLPRLEIFCPFLWNLRPDRSCHFFFAPPPSSTFSFFFIFFFFSSISRPFLRFKIKKAFASFFRSNEGISAMLRLRSPARPRIWVTIQLWAVEGSRPTAFFESTAFLNIFETSFLFAHHFVIFYFNYRSL